MARHLWILRHGEAVPHGAARDDAARELTPRGRRQAGAAGAALARLGLAFAACYTSPKVRARDTAAIACEALGLRPWEEPSLADGFDLGAALDLLAPHGDGERILVVGHNPSLAQVVHDFTGARVELKKGGVAAVAVDGGASALHALMRPVELESLAGAR